MGWHGAQGGNCSKCTADSWCFAGVKTSCPSGTSAHEPGAFSIDECSCIAGYSGDENGEACEACKGGTFKAAVGLGVCSPCDANTYSNITGAISNAACLQCPANTVSMQESNQIKDCTCLEGYTGSDGTACTACSAGTYKPDRGSAACTACDEGSYSDQEAAVSIDSCSGCQLHSSSSSGSSGSASCVCYEGYYDSTKHDPNT
jgi:hypothetical protein